MVILCVGDTVGAVDFALFELFVEWLCNLRYLVSFAFDISRNNSTRRPIVREDMFLWYKLKVWIEDRG